VRGVDQTRFGVPEGNCFVACVASILEVSIDQVDMARLDQFHVRWCTAYEADADSVDAKNLGDSWWRVLQATLARYDKQALYYPVADGREKLAPFEYSIASGPSPRPGVPAHSVVVNDGIIAWDPHPSHAGLAGSPNEYILIVPFRRLP
jgi:hypothetical protein